MATTTKFPATVPPSRAPAIPGAKAAAAAVASGGGGGGGGTSGFKLFVWLLAILNVAAAGGWAWFKYSKTEETQRTLATTRRQLIKLETDLDLLHGTVQGIARDGVNEVSDPGKLIGELSTALGIRDYLLISPVSSQKFHRTNYTEKSVKVTFLQKKVYKFNELVLFLTTLEKANPTVQIKDMEFGLRTPATTGSDTWIPTQCTVRVLQLTESAGG
jgi:hypothetical protein